MNHEVPEVILDLYDIGKVREVKVITDGLVHQTFSLSTSQGEYILQKLHPVLATDEIAEDFEAVTNYLKQQKFPTPQLVHTTDGERLVRQDEQAWRMQTRLPGQTVHVFEDIKMAQESAAIYARFHQVMDNCKHVFKAKKRLHETQKEYERLKEALEEADPSLLKEIQDELEIIQTELPKYFLPEDLPLRVIHGDPKVSNILFDEKANATAIIDLDTCNRRPVLVELGDAFRSWCGKQEDDPNNTFDLNLFKSAWDGYVQEMGEKLTLKEKMYIPQAIGTIMLELACRFLTDYLNDNYFGWDVSRYTSRRAHNLARCRGQLSEFRDYKRQLPQIREYIK